MADGDSGSALATQAAWEELFARRATLGGDEITAILSLVASGDVITFSGGFPAPETFPVDVIRSLTDELLTQQAARALQYTPTEGLPEARASIAGLIESTQGVAVEPADLLVTSGGIEALELLARTFIEPGDLVLVEGPTYLGAIMAFAGFEATMQGVPLDADGLSVEALERTLAGERRPKLLYVIPDHQNPTGLSLAADKRAAVVDLCRRHGVLVVEDVAYRDLGFDGTAPESLWSHAPGGVVQIGTFSKTFTPGVRLGWAAGPAPIIRAMTAAKQNSDQCAGALGQMLMSRYVDSGHFARNLVPARALYASRAAAMTAALQEHMPAGTTWTRPRGGFFVWVTLPSGLDARSLTAAAARAGVAYVPGTPFFTDGGGVSSLRLSYSRATEPDIVEGVRRLGTLVTTEIERA